MCTITPPHSLYLTFPPAVTTNVRFIAVVQWFPNTTLSQIQRANWWKPLLWLQWGGHTRSLVHFTFIFIRKQLHCHCHRSSSPALTLERHATQRLREILHRSAKTDLDVHCKRKPTTSHTYGLVAFSDKWSTVQSISAASAHRKHVLLSDISFVLTKLISVGPFRCKHCRFSPFGRVQQSPEKRNDWLIAMICNFCIHFIAPLHSSASPL